MLPRTWLMVAPVRVAVKVGFASLPLAAARLGDSARAPARMLWRRSGQGECGFKGLACELERRDQ